MPARMCYRNIVLCVALAFWVACNNDSSSNTAVEISAPDEVSSSSEVVTEISSSSVSSSSKTQEISSSSKIQEDSVSIGISSSSKNQESSSSSVVSSSSESPTDVTSSSEEYPYMLRDDPSVHCKDSVYYAQASCSSFRPEPQMDKPNSQASPPLPGMGPITCWEYPVPAFACDNGRVCSKGGDCSLVGDTVVPRKTYSLEELCEIRIKEAEASTKYPYVLKTDSTVYCKIMYEVKPDMERPCSSYYLCEDGNCYDREDMLDNEYGLIYERRTTEE